MYCYVLPSARTKSTVTQQAIDWINEVRNRANLADLELEDFNSADKLFEQIANVERPKEFDANSDEASTSSAGDSSMTADACNN